MVGNEILAHVRKLCSRYLHACTDCGSFCYLHFCVKAVCRWITLLSWRFNNNATKCFEQYKLCRTHWHLCEKDFTFHEMTKLKLRFIILRDNCGKELPLWHICSICSVQLSSIWSELEWCKITLYSFQLKFPCICLTLQTLNNH